MKPFFKGKLKKSEIVVLLCLSTLSLVGVISIVLMCLGFSIFNFDADFKGGSAAYLQFPNEPENSDISAIYDAINQIPGVTAYSVTVDSENTNNVLIKTSALSSTTQNEFYYAVENALGTDDYSLFWLEDIRPVISVDFVFSYIIAIIVACVIAFLYASIRFKLKKAVFFIFSVIANIPATIALCSFLYLPINLYFLGSIFAAFFTTICSNTLLVSIINSENSFRQQRNSQIIKTFAYPYITGLLFISAVAVGVFIVYPLNIYSLFCPYIISCIVQIPILFISARFYKK